MTRLKKSNIGRKLKNGDFLIENIVECWEGGN